MKKARSKAKSNQVQREYRARTGNKATKKYEKTPKGFLMRMYRNMKSRVTGVQKKKFHLYYGLPIMLKKEFYEWALNSWDFKILFQNWAANGFKPRETPSINRINNKKGYTKENCEFVTHSANSYLGSLSRWSKYG